MKVFPKIVVLALLALFTSMFGYDYTGSASAGTPLGMCSTTPGSDIQDARDDLLLPLNRWAEGTGQLHTRLQTGVFDVGDQINAVQKQMVAGTMINAGNMMFRMAAALVTEADRFCIGQEIYYQVDQVAASVGKAMMNDTSTGPSAVSLFAGIAMIAAVLMVAKGDRGQARKKIVSMIIGASAVAIMITGATQSTETKSGFLSPSYVANGINEAISTVAQAPAGAMADVATDNALEEAGAGGWEQHCSHYTKHLRDAYRTAFTSAPGGAQHMYIPPEYMSLESSAVVPMALNAMWENTGMKIYTQVQFGPNNPWGPKVFCRALEYKSGVSTTMGETPDERTANVWGARTQTGVTHSLGGSNPEGTYPFRVISDVDLDKTLVAWAACSKDDSGGFKVNGAFKDNFGISDGDCDEFFTNTDENYRAEKFDIGNGNEKIKNKGGPWLNDFVSNLHGTSNTGAVGTLMIYVIASLVVSAVFIILGIAVFVAKIGLLVMSFMFILVVVASILPVGDGASKIGIVLKQYAGMAFLAFGASLIISMVAAITGILHGLGGTISENWAWQLIWMGLSPAIALFMVNYVFTKVLKAPSPFSINAAKGFGAAAAGGAIGGAVGGGVASRTLSRMGWQASNAMADRIRGGGRRGGAAIDKSKGKIDTKKAGEMSAEGPNSLNPGLAGAAAGTAAGAAAGTAVRSGTGKSAKDSADGITGGLAAGAGGSADGITGGLAAGAGGSADGITGGLAAGAAGGLAGATLSDYRADNATLSERQKLNDQFRGDANRFHREQTRAAATDNIKSSFSKAKSVAAPAVGGLAAAGTVALSKTTGAASSVRDAYAQAKQDATTKGVARPTDIAKKMVGNAHSKAWGSVKSGARSMDEAITRRAHPDSRGRIGKGAYAKAALASAGVAAWQGTKAAGKGLAGAGKMGAKGLHAAPKAAMAGKRFAGRHKTALKAAALGAATVATAGVAAPLAGAYLAKKGVDGARSVKRRYIPNKEQQQQNNIAYAQHLTQQQQARQDEPRWSDGRPIGEPPQNEYEGSLGATGTDSAQPGTKEPPKTTAKSLGDEGQASSSESSGTAPLASGLVVRPDESRDGSMPTTGQPEHDSSWGDGFPPPEEPYDPSPWASDERPGESLGGPDQVPSSRPPKVQAQELSTDTGTEGSLSEPSEGSGRWTPNSDRASGTSEASMVPDQAPAPAPEPTQQAPEQQQAPAPEPTQQAPEQQQAPAPEPTQQAPEQQQAPAPGPTQQAPERQQAPAPEPTQQAPTQQAPAPEPKQPPTMKPRTIVADDQPKE